MAEIFAIQIRQYAKSDYPAIRALWEKTGLILGLSDEPEELHRILDYHPELFLVVKVNGHKSLEPW